MGLSQNSSSTRNVVIKISAMQTLQCEGNLGAPDGLGQAGKTKVDIVQSPLWDSTNLPATSGPEVATNSPCCHHSCCARTHGAQPCEAFHPSSLLAPSGLHLRTQQPLENSTFAATTDTWWGMPPPIDSEPLVQIICCHLRKMGGPVMSLPPGHLHSGPQEVSLYLWF